MEEEDRAGITNSLHCGNAAILELEKGTSGNIDAQTAAHFT
jgi:hypothetical protein